MRTTRTTTREALAALPADPGLRGAPAAGGPGSVGPPAASAPRAPDPPTARQLQLFPGPRPPGRQLPGPSAPVTDAAYLGHPAEQW